MFYIENTKSENKLRSRRRASGRRCGGCACETLGSCGCPAEISYTCQSFAGCFYCSWFLLPKPSRFTVFYFMLLAVDLFFFLQANLYVTLWFYRVRLSESCSVWVFVVLLFWFVEQKLRSFISHDISQVGFSVM